MMGVLAETENTPAAWSARAAAAEPWEAAGWSRESQQARFAAVAHAVNAQPLERLLDFGCGTGGYTAHVPERVSYVGYDFSPGMVARATRDHPGFWFTADWPGGGLDIVIAAGCFNLPGNWSKSHTWHTLRHLWDTTGCSTLAVSLYAGDDDRCLIYDEQEVHDRLLGESYLGTVTRWRPNDLLAVLQR